MRLDDPLRRALAEVEGQRDDGLAYLGALRAVLEALEQSAGVRACALAVARALVRELAVESCAVVLREDGRESVVGYASQGDRFGEPGDGLPVERILALARSLLAAQPADAASDHDVDAVELYPLRIRNVLEGALVLQVGVPGQSFARARALQLVADAVAHALGVARAQASLSAACNRLQREVGETQAIVAARDSDLRDRSVLLGECEKQLARLTEDLGRANRVKQEFLGLVSHELRTPLNAVIGFGQLLREDLDDGGHAEQLGMVDAILGGGLRLGALVDDMLFFVELCSTRFVPRLGQVDVRRLVDSALAQIDAPVREAAGTIRVEVARDAEYVRLDRTLLGKGLFHAIDNACKFADGGGVRVHVARAPGGTLAIDVSDEGVGMEPHEVERAFQPFSQRDGSLSRAHAGLGLGLALVRRVVEIQGGSVALESRPGRGTTLRIRLPLDPGERSPLSAGRAA
ncbi:MAG: HAMP domain-containing sensor histidine kinase [Thermodesulfobacteriota bacterium]